MKNTLLAQVGNKIQSTKQTITNLFKECQPQTINQHEIDFEDVLLEKDSLSGKN
jgi:hypothetical protein